MLLPTAASADESAIQPARLRQFLNWLLVSCVAVAVGYAILWVAFSNAVAGLASCAMAGLIAATLVSRTRLDRGKLSAAVMLISIALLVTGAVFTLINPGVMPVLVFIPVLVVVIALPYIGGRALRALMLVCLAQTAGIVACAQYLRLYDALPAWANDLIVLTCVPLAVGLILLLLWQFRDHLAATLARTRAANEALQAAHAGLEAQVAERTAALQYALGEVEARAAVQARLLDENSQQRATILEMSVPVLPVTADTLVMPLVGAMDSARLAQLRQQALGALERSSARRLLLDITGVPVVDSQVAQGLIATVQAGRLLGAEVTLVGIRPEVAQAIVGLGLHLQGVRTFSDLQTALRPS